MIFIPAILLITFFVYTQILRYEPLYPDYAKFANQQQQLAFVPILTQDAIIGSRQAAKTIISFEDISCEHCRDEMSIFRELLQQYPRDVKIVWKGLAVVDFPQEHMNTCFVRMNKENLLSFSLRRLQIKQILPKRHCKELQ